MGNRIILAAAGAGKTQRLVEEALSRQGQRVLITTYTKRNVQEITERIVQMCGLVPACVRIETWFSFLLREAIKPYQGAVTSIFRTRSINFEAERPRFVPKRHFDKYYFDRASNVYQDSVADLACVINEKTNGKTIGRLEQIFDLILVDELQDLVGYDLDFIDALIKSRIGLTLVGDPRQFTYASNKSSRNRCYRGFGIHDWIEKRRKRGAVDVEFMNWSYRCNRLICRFSDALFPDQLPTEARNNLTTDHDGVFLIAIDDLPVYTAKFKPMVLRWNRKTRISSELQASVANIGNVKGCTFDRVVIFPTQPMLKYLRTGNLSDAGETERFYVAVTRAKYSIGFVVADQKTRSAFATFWSPP